MSVVVGIHPCAAGRRPGSHAGEGRRYVRHSWPRRPREFWHRQWRSHGRQQHRRRPQGQQQWDTAVGPEVEVEIKEKEEAVEAAIDRANRLADNAASLRQSERAIAIRTLSARQVARQFTETLGPSRAGGFQFVALWFALRRRTNGACGRENS